MGLNSNVIRIAKEAGFVFWEDEEWGKGPSNIDWAAEYSDEFKKFSFLLLNEIKEKISDENAKRILDEYL